MATTASPRLARWLAPFVFAPLLATALAGCGADASTGPVVPRDEQAKAASANMEDFMKQQAKAKAKPNTKTKSKGVARK